MGRSEMLARTLGSLATLDPSPHEVIVVDGDPSDVAAGSVASELPGAVYVRSQPGLTRQRNEALARARGDIILFVDDDVEVSSDLLVHLRRAYADPAVVGATGRVIEPTAPRIMGASSRFRGYIFGKRREGTFTIFGYPRRLTAPEGDRDVEFMQGCFMSARIVDARAVGFDEALHGYALAEDEDFSFRLSRRGRIRYVAEAVVNHANRGFLDRDERDFGRQVVVNRTYLFRKNFPQTMRARIAFRALLVGLVMHRILNREWRGARGLVDGMREASRS